MFKMHENRYQADNNKIDILLLCTTSNIQ